MATRHLLRVGDLDRLDIEALLDRAESLRRDPKSTRSRVGAVLGLALFQPSTRTLTGFQAAMARLGGASVVLSNLRMRPEMSEPESLEDTIRVLSAYCDALVFRHESPDALELAVAVTSCPVVNAGNGDDEHPTQALIDLFAIRRWHRRLDGLRIGIVGDMRGSRSTHSLIGALVHFAPAEIRLMFPHERGLPPAWRVPSLPFTDREGRLDFDDLDVLYMAGLPPGTGEDVVPGETRAKLRLSAADAAARLPSRAVILSPLPRIDEIDRAVDERPNARYFEQSGEAQYVRMAVLERVLA